jgi:lactate permease
MWSQNYDPLGNPWLSTLIAAVPVVVLLGGLGIVQIKAHIAALLGLVAALLIATAVFHMPVPMAGKAAMYGAMFGLLPIGWIIFNLIFLYRLTQEAELFTILQDSIATITDDRRLQLLLIAFAFGAFFEGAAGGGTPVAVTGAILMGLGFSPLSASGLSLIANTAPVAYGGLGTPIMTLQGVTGLDLMKLSGMVGRQLPFFSVLVPIWLVWAFAGFRGMVKVLPAILVSGVSFAIAQFYISNYWGPLLVDVISALVSIVCLSLFLRVWRPAEVWINAQSRTNATISQEEARRRRQSHAHTPEAVRRAWMPWIILTVTVLIWGLPPVKAFLNDLGSMKIPIDGLDKLIQRVPPVVAPGTKPEGAVFMFNYLSVPGTGLLLAAIIAGTVMRIPFGRMVKIYGETFIAMRYSFITIAAMLALGYTTRYSGMDATLGLAFAHAGWFYPFFGTLIGWVGTALTGTDAASNALFGSQQKITSELLGLPPYLMTAANSSGGVMGKMIDAQSIVVASIATNYHGREGEILRYVFFHSIALASLVGVLVMLQAYVWPFTAMVFH